MTKQAGGDRPLQILASLYLKVIYLGLVVMFDYKRNWCHFCFKGICGINTNNLGKCLIMFATVLIIGVKSIYVIKHRFIKAVLFLKILKVGENTFQ